MAVLMALKPLGYRSLGGNDADPSRLHEWQFDGDATDGVGGNDGTLQGDPAYSSATVKSGSESVQMDGSGDWVTLASNVSFATSDPWSLTYWAYNTAAEGSQLIPIGDDTNSDDYVYHNDANTNFVVNYGTGDSPAHTWDEPHNQWNLITVSQPGDGSYTWYINGSELASGTVANGTSMTINNIGLGHSSTGFEWNGCLDRVMIHDKALSLEEHQDYYNNP